MMNLKTFENFEFKAEPSKKDKLYIVINYEYCVPEYHEFKNIKFSEYKNHLNEINRTIKIYKMIEYLLNEFGCERIRLLNFYKAVENKIVSDPSFLSRDKILSRDWDDFGEEVKKIYCHEIPGDPRSDGETLCYLEYIELVGYDSEGNKHKATIT